MATNQPERFDFLAQLYQEQAQEALERMGQLQQQRQQLERQIKQLQQYWLDYQNKLTAIARNGARAGQLIEFRSFMDKMEIAIRGQEQQLSKINDQWQQASATWQHLHYKSKALDEMANKAHSQQRAVLEKRQQKEQDDRTCSQFRARIGLKNAE